MDRYKSQISTTREHQKVSHIKYPICSASWDPEQDAGSHNSGHKIRQSLNIGMKEQAYTHTQSLIIYKAKSIYNHFFGTTEED